MKVDMTLLDKDGAPTIEELKVFFRDHDFSTQRSKYNPGECYRHSESHIHKGEKAISFSLE